MVDNPDNIVIIHPNFENLKKEIEKLRIELSMFVLEKDNLIYQECKNIEMAYMLNFGSLEYKIYKTECAILRLKRKIELIQMKKNRQEKIILSTIEKILDDEFAKYEAILEEQIAKINAALKRSGSIILTESETKELKKLYRVIVKALHPDLHPDISNEKLHLFHNAVEAYENGDLEAIRIISEMVNEVVLPENISESFTYLIKEQERLMQLIKSIKDKIDEIKSKYPYTMKSIVDNPDKSAARKAELEIKIASLNEIYSMYNQRIAEMLR